MEKRTRNLVGILAAGAVGLSGAVCCSSEKRSFNQTRLFYNPQDKSASIWAVDYDGVKEVTLSNNGKILVRDPMEWTYIKNPHGVSVKFGASRIERGVYVDESLKADLPDGRYSVGVRDIKGNYFEKPFTKKDNKISSP